MSAIDSKVREPAEGSLPGKGISGDRNRDSRETARVPTRTGPPADARLTFWFKELRARAASSHHRARTARPDPQS
jgi:hypothetical protein